MSILTLSIPLPRGKTTSMAPTILSSVPLPLHEGLPRFSAVQARHRSQAPSRGLLHNLLRGLDEHNPYFLCRNQVTRGS